MLRKVLLSALLVVVTSVSAQAQVPRWKLNQGDQFYIEESATMKMRITENGSTSNQTIVAKVLSQVTVLERRFDGSVVLELRIESSKMGTPGALQSDPALTGASFRLTLDSSMNATDFEGYDDLIRRVSGGDSAVEAEIRRTMSKDEMMRRFSEPFNLYLPGNGSTNGTSWTRNRNVTLATLGTADMTFRYSRIGAFPSGDGSVEYISLSADGTYNQPASGPFSNGDVQFKGISGTVQFDATRGRLVSLSIHMPVKGSFSISQGFFTSRVTADIEIDQTVRVLDHKPIELSRR